MAEEAVPLLDEDPNRTRYEEAKLCPKCGKPGEVRGSHPAPPGRGIQRGTMLEMCYCTTKSPFECSWYNTCWMIQVNPDGTVPPPKNHTFSQKEYIADPNADAIIAQINESLAQQQVAETKPGGSNLWNE